MPPVYLGRHWCRLVPVQLSFWDHLLGSRETSGGNGDVTPPLLDHDGGLFSTMTTHDYTSETTVLAATPIRPRKTYPQNWPAYNAAQCSEKDSVMALLGDLCAQIEEPPYKGGRPALSLTDMVYVSTMKTYEGFSARRFNCDVQDARRRGFIQGGPVAGHHQPPYLRSPASTHHHGPDQAERRPAHHGGGFLRRRQFRLLDLHVRQVARSQMGAANRPQDSIQGLSAGG